jgi:hypothetical protein
VWSLSPPPCDEYQRLGFQPPHASLLIEFVDGHGHAFKLWNTLTLYYGSDASSTVDLAAGETIRFRAPIHLRNGPFRPEGFTPSRVPTRMSATATWVLAAAPERCDVRFTKPSAPVQTTLRSAR